MRSPLVGTAYQARSTSLNNQQCINLYLESVQTKDGATPAGLMPCPGLNPTGGFVLPHGPVRRMRPVGNTIYAVGGNTAYSVTGGVVTALGTLLTSTGDVTIEVNSTRTANPNQIGFFDRLQPYCWTPATSTFSAIAMPFAGPVGDTASLETLTLALQAGSYNVYQSNPNDLTTWNPLAFTTEDGNPEPVIALQEMGDQICFLKSYSLCFYVNAGLNPFSFQRLDGIYPLIGIAAEDSVVQVNNIICFLGQTRDGGPRVFIMPGYAPEQMSTFAIENTISNYATISDAVGWSYIQGGHMFYGLNFPTAGATWVLDITESRNLRVPVWHQRAGFAAGNFTIYDAQTFAQLGNVVYAGSRSTGQVYKLDLTTSLDNNGTRKWLRSWRALQGPADFTTDKCNYLDIQMDTGNGVPVGTNPQLMLEQSFDNGDTWSAQRFQSAGQTGQTSATVRFRRLGAVKRGLNNDRTFRLSATDQMNNAIVGADIG